MISELIYTSIRKALSTCLVEVRFEFSSVRVKRETFCSMVMVSSGRDQRSDSHYYNRRQQQRSNHGSISSMGLIIMATLFSAIELSIVSIHKDMIRDILDNRELTKNCDPASVHSRDSGSPLKNDESICIDSYPIHPTVSWTYYNGPFYLHDDTSYEQFDSVIKDPGLDDWILMCDDIEACTPIDEVPFDEVCNLTDYQLSITNTPPRTNVAAPV